MNTRVILHALSLAIMFTIAGCAATAKEEFVLGHDPLMDQKGGVLLIVDSCILRDALLGTNDAYVVAESKAAAQELLDTSRKYLSDSGVQIHTALIPFVCGALLDANTSPQRIAERIDGPVRMAPQPFSVAEEVSNDREYVAALSSLSTYAFQRAKALQTGTTARRKALKAGKAASFDPTGSSPTDESLFISPGDVKTAAALIAARTNVSSVVYLGMLGNSRSTEKVVAQDAGDVLIGAAIGIASGGIVNYTPVHFDTTLECAGLLNLEPGELVWANCLNPGGDPTKPATTARPEVIEGLLFDLVHRPKATKPGEDAL